MGRSATFYVKYLANIASSMRQYANEASGERVATVVKGGVATIEFSNPPKRGALTPEMLVHLRRSVVELPQSDGVRVIVLRGSQETFSSGYAIDRIPAADELKLRDEIEELCDAIESSPLAVIALLRGTVIGAALDVAAACDIRYAARDCRLAMTPAKLGLVYSATGTARIHRLVGPDWCRMLFFTSEPISAELARTIGLVTDVFDSPKELESATYTLAAAIAKHSSIAVGGAKQICRVLEKDNLSALEMAPRA